MPEQNIVVGIATVPRLKLKPAGTGTTVPLLSSNTSERLTGFAGEELGVVVAKLSMRS